MTEREIDIIIRTLASCFPDMNYTISYDLGDHMLAVGICTRYKGSVHMVTDQTARMRIRAEHSDRTQAYISHLRVVVTELHKALAEEIELESRKYDE